MCLKNSIASSTQKRFIRELEVREDGYVWLWKVFNLDKEKNLVAQFQDYSFYEGKNTAKKTIILNYFGNEAELQYDSGFHCCLTKEAAEYWMKNSWNDKKTEQMVVPIKVRKTWITDIGYQVGPNWVIVCKHIII